MKVQDRERALLELIAEHRDEEFRRLLVRAREEATELLRQTYCRERRDLHRRVVETPGASLDASIEGLLADRRVLEARLLALLPEDKAP